MPSGARATLEGHVADPRHRTRERSEGRRRARAPARAPPARSAAGGADVRRRGSLSARAGGRRDRVRGGGADLPPAGRRDRRGGGPARPAARAGGARPDRACGRPRHAPAGARGVSARTWLHGGGRRPVRRARPLAGHAGPLHARAARLGLRRRGARARRGAGGALLRLPPPAGGARPSRRAGPCAGGARRAARAARRLGRAAGAPVRLRRPGSAAARRGRDAGRARRGRGLGGAALRGGPRGVRRPRRHRRAAEAARGPPRRARRPLGALRRARAPGAAPPGAAAVRGRRRAVPAQRRRAAAGGGRRARGGGAGGGRGARADARRRRARGHRRARARGRRGRRGARRRARRLRRAGRARRARAAGPHAARRRGAGVRASSAPGRHGGRRDRVAADAGQARRPRRGRRAGRASAALGGGDRGRRAAPVGGQARRAGCAGGRGGRGPRRAAGRGGDDLDGAAPAPRGRARPGGGGRRAHGGRAARRGARAAVARRGRSRAAGGRPRGGARGARRGHGPPGRRARRRARGGRAGDPRAPLPRGLRLRPAGGRVPAPAVARAVPGRRRTHVARARERARAAPPRGRARGGAPSLLRVRVAAGGGPVPLLPLLRRGRRSPAGLAVRRRRTRTVHRRAVARARHAAAGGGDLAARDRADAARAAPGAGGRAARARAGGAGPAGVAGGAGRPGRPRARGRARAGDVRRLRRALAGRVGAQARARGAGPGADAQGLARARRPGDDAARPEGTHGLGAAGAGHARRGAGRARARPWRGAGEPRPRAVERPRQGRPARARGGPRALPAPRGGVRRGTGAAVAGVELRARGRPARCAGAQRLGLLGDGAGRPDRRRHGRPGRRARLQGQDGPRRCALGAGRPAAGGAVRAGRQGAARARARRRALPADRQGRPAPARVRDRGHARPLRQRRRGGSRGARRGAAGGARGGARRRAGDARGPDPAVPVEVLAQRLRLPGDLPGGRGAAAGGGGAVSAPRFTAEQRAAIEDRSGSSLLAANAGSGKTAVMVERFVEAVLKDGVAVVSINEPTTTEKAAGELRERARKRLHDLGEDEHARAVDAAWIGTIHGFCARVLRSRPLAAGLDPRFTVLEETAAGRLAAAAYERALEAWVAALGRPAVDLAAAYGPGLRDLVLLAHDTLRSRGAAPRLAIPAERPAPSPAALVEAHAVAAAELAGAGDGIRVTEGRSALDACARLLAPAGAGGDAPPAAVPSAVREARPAAVSSAVRGARPAAVPSPGELDAAKLGAGAKALATEACEAYRTAWETYRSGCADHHARAAVILLDELLARFAREYAEGKAERAAVDFEDLELGVRDLFSDEAERRRWSERFALLMVDEFQDTNRLQLDLLEALERDTDPTSPAGTGNLFAVGDEFQSIYRFRHADVQIFRERRAKLDAARVRGLRANFRSAPELLDVLNATFAPVFGDAFQPLVAGRPRDAAPAASGTGELRLFDPDPPAGVAPVELLVTASKAWDELAGEVGLGALAEQPWRRAEARLVAHRLREEVRAGRRPGDVVVLVRATASLRLFEQALEEQGLPTYVVGGRGYWSQEQVRDGLAYLSALANPRDETALYGVLASPFCGVGSDALVLLAQAGREGRRGPWAALRDGGAWLAAVPEADRERLVRFARFFAAERARAERLPPETLLERAITATGYDLAILARTGGERRLANLRKLMRLAREYEHSEGRDLRGFLEFAATQDLAEAREGEAALESDGLDAVRLMTIHRAKGLEFPVVCVADLGRQGAGGRPRLLLGHDGTAGLRLAPLGGGDAVPALAYERLAAEEDRADAEEERRLLYVAMTRARESLILSGGTDAGRWPEPRPGGAPLDWIVRAVAGEPRELFAAATEHVLERDWEGRAARVRCALSSPATLGELLPRAALAPEA